MFPSLLQVIAIVTDSLTDLDIFHDLQEACTQRCVPVYVLLDQISLSGFLQMCKNLNVRLDDLQVYLLAFSPYFSVHCLSDPYVWAWLSLAQKF